MDFSTRPNEHIQMFDFDDIAPLGHEDPSDEAKGFLRRPQGYWILLSNRLWMFITGLSLL